MKTVFIAALGLEDKANALSRGDTRRFVDTEQFSLIPGSPFAYWASPQAFKAFSEHPAFETHGREARRGSSTGDDARRVRAWWEVSPAKSIKWQQFAKGGSFSLFYSDITLVAAWDAKRRTYADFIGRPGREIERPESTDHYFRAGLTWSRRTQAGFGMRAMPAGCIFADKGPAAFVEGDHPEDLLALLAISTSSLFRYLVDLQMAFGSYEVGVIQRTPVPDVSSKDRKALSTLARRAWSLKRTLDTTNETSHAFVLPAPLLSRVTVFDPNLIEDELSALQSEIDDHVFRLYGFAGTDRSAVEAWIRHGKSFSTAEVQDEASSVETRSDEDEDNDPLVGDALGSLHSWTLGVAFGRFDIRLVTGERMLPPEPEPFASLPERSPGMVPSGDKPFRANGGILVDDPGHPDDLTSIAETIFSAARIPHATRSAEDNDTGDELGEQQFIPEVFRAWLRRDAFPDHVRQYSKSRRKAPIFWRLGTSSGSYSVWLDAHALTKDTLFRVQNDYIAPKLTHEQRQLDVLRANAGLNSSAAQKRAIEAQQSLVEEIQALHSEVKRVAPLWNPNLDDGVIISFALLWRVVAHNKSWQRELRATWDALQRGDYDWAQIAMHLWPERVVIKCQEDRSLAIAHRLEEVFWIQDESGKWKRRNMPTWSVGELVRERSSEAVKAALGEFRDASEATGVARRTRRKA